MVTCQPVGQRRLSSPSPYQAAVRNVSSGTVMTFRVLPVITYLTARCTGGKKAIVPPHSSHPMDIRRNLALVVVAAVCGASRSSSAPGVAPAAIRAGAVLVGFEARLGVRSRQRLAAEMGVTRMQRVRKRAHLLHVAPGREDEVITALRKHHDVRFAEPDYVQTLSGVPNDPLLSNQWAFRNTGQSV